MKRKLSVPTALRDAIKCIPSSNVTRALSKFPIALKVQPIPPKPGWVEVVIDDPNGSLVKHTDHQLRNLLMLTYLKTPPEFCYRNFVAGMFADAKVEVPVSVGIVDVMTEWWVIEVKIAVNWKHALGQAIAYAHVTGKAPSVALYGQIPTIARDIFLVQGVDILDLGDL